MQYRLNDSLGTDDARKCNASFGSNLDLTAAKLAKGETIDLTGGAAEFLTKKYPALLEPTRQVRGEAKRPEITAPEKQFVPEKQ